MLSHPLWGESFETKRLFGSLSKPKEGLLKVCRVRVWDLSKAPQPGSSTTAPNSLRTVPLKCRKPQAKAFKLLPRLALLRRRLETPGKGFRV